MKHLIILIFIHIILLFNFRYIAWPENFVWPYLATQGFSLYNDIFYIYPPLYFWLLTIWGKFFGISLISLQILNYLIIIIIDILLYLALKNRLWPFLIFIPLQIFLEGNGFWPDQFLAVFFLAVYLCLQNRQFFLGGIFLGLAIVTKQTAFYFVSITLLTTKPLHWPKIVTGLLIPIFLTLALLTVNQSLNNFFQQSVIYILSFHAGNKWQQLWPNLNQIFVISIIFGLPLIMGLVKKQNILVLLTVASSLGIFTRFSYFHLQPSVPFLVILLSLIKPKWKFTIPFLLSIIFLFIKFSVNNFQFPPKFLNSQTITTAVIISKYIPPKTETLILTSNDHYYWLTQTIPVGYFFTTSTPWNLAYNNIEEKIITNLKQNPPKFVVIDQRINKITSYIRACYRPILELPDGSSIFEYNPMCSRQEI